MSERVYMYFFSPFFMAMGYLCLRNSKTSGDKMDLPYGIFMLIMGVMTFVVSLHVQYLKEKREKSRTGLRQKGQK